ncbi:hypothetical protein F5888DRAFT_700093 [Russula emetica]|nr:hypothetical protein F5888DRAFT_700093 [Russula emetica]
MISVDDITCGPGGRDVPAFPGQVCSCLLATAALQRPECSLLAIIGMPILPSRSPHQIPEPSLQHLQRHARSGNFSSNDSGPPLPLSLSTLPHARLRLPPLTRRPVLSSGASRLLVYNYAHAALALVPSSPLLPSFSTLVSMPERYFSHACCSQATPFSMTAIHVWAHAPSLRALMTCLRCMLRSRLRTLQDECAMVMEGRSGVFVRCREHTSHEW